MDILYYIVGLIVLSVVGRLLKRKPGASTPPRRIQLFPRPPRANTPRT